MPYILTTIEIMNLMHGAWYLEIDFGTELSGAQRTEVFLRISLIYIIYHRIQKSS